MKKLARITSAEPLGGFAVRLTFTDGLVRELDLEPMLAGPVLKRLRDARLFTQLSVDTVTGTLAWPGGIDLDPDVLHGDHEPATGQGPTLINQHHLSQTG